MSIARLESQPPHPMYPGKSVYDVGDAIQKAIITKEIFSKSDNLAPFNEIFRPYKGYFIEDAAIFFDKDDLKVAKLGQPTVTSGGGTKAVPIPSKPTLPQDHLVVPYDRIRAERGMKMILEYGGVEYFLRLHPIQNTTQSTPFIN